MRLFEHPDFEQAVLRAAEHFREPQTCALRLSRKTISLQRPYGSSPPPPATK